MPRAPTGIYSIPPGTDGVPDRTVDSSKYNSFIHDVETDLNTPRPIIAGGTGASSAAGALANLGGEQAKQIVTNWDSMVFVAGSFYAASSATGLAPVSGHAFSGICYVTDASNMFIEARDQDDNIRPGRTYVRQLKAGIWSAWGQDLNNVGSSSAIGAWVFSNATTFPPTVGQVRFNNVAQASTTHVFVSHLTGTSVDVTSQLPAVIQPGGKLFVQEVGVPADYISFNIVSVVFTGGDADITVTFLDGGTAIANTANAALSFAAPAGASMFVRYDNAQILTPAQQAQAQQNMYAAPFDAMAFNGMQINGNCEVAQGVGGPYNSGNLATTGFNTTVSDGWRLIVVNAAATASFAFGLGTPLGGLLSAPLAQWFQMANGLAAQGTIANGDCWIFRQLVEGFRVQRLLWGTASAQPLFYGFRFYCTIAGTLLVKVFNNTAARLFYREHTVAVGWNWVTGTIPGDIVGTWEKSFNCGIGFDVIVVGKSASIVAPNAWTATNTQQSTNSTNFLGATAATAEITGLILLPGLYGPTDAQAPNIMRPFDHELLLSQRYYEKTYDYGNPPGTATQNGCDTHHVNYSTSAFYANTFSSRFRVVKRATPTVISYSTATGTQGKVYDFVNGVDVNVSFGQVGMSALTWGATEGASNSGAGFLGHWTADARL